MDDKINVIGSTRTKITLAQVLLILVSGLVMYFTFNVNVKKSIKEVNQNYIQDLAISYGKSVDAEIGFVGLEQALSSETLESIVAGKGLQGVSSSYIYVVSPDGTMLYHPTADKIGQPVENAAVKQTVADISAGKKVQNSVISYEFKGAQKYAGVYVNEEQQYILVCTADEDELLGQIKDISRSGLLRLLLVVFFGIGVGSLFAALIFKPINEISRFTVKASTMDLTMDSEQQRLNERHDESGRMSRALSKLLEEMQTVVGDIKTKSENVMSAADALNSDANETSTTMEQVESAVNDIAQGASSQAEETQKATENVMVMGNMVHETNDEVNKLLKYAEGMKESTDYAKNILARLNDVNKKAEEYIDVIANQTNTTNESALRISEATKLITSIAEETNLLSLNASIEAARAGEQGRGFAVVAAEIQKLAEQSNESARQIEDIIQMLLSDSEKAVETMYDVKEIIRAQSEQVEQTDMAFDQINEGVGYSIDGINRISVKTEMLDEARVNVVDVVQNLTAIAEENAASAEETSASVCEVSSIVEDISSKSTALKEIAQELDKSMDIFKL
ncbi:MAG: methyl-accepting chemotaxis protein [Clostridium sp.]|nr:methyl-accepting chemotaxis protein [Clostridium sp.]MCM1398725.1 methyl-accepting chemotaxis protein [Clostridium sp.]MCM1458643.1 methyl-accepting chemotaxis protein [Bacteroides sp.]